MEPVLKDKRGLILGVANQRSLAWHVAKSAAKQGARLGITYQNERFASRVHDLVQENADDFPEIHTWACDATEPKQIDQVFKDIDEKWGGLDFVAHCWAYSPPRALKGPVADTAWDDYKLTQQVSAHSLIEVCRRAAPLMDGQGSVVTLSYYGAEKVVPGYNAMGIAKASLEATVRYLAWDLGQKGVRVNAISAGPVNTLSARGVPNFVQMMNEHAEKSPLGRNVETAEIGNTSAFLFSTWASGITGQVLYVDAGYSIMGT